MTDAFADFSAGLDSPISSAFAVDLSSADVVLDEVTRSVYVGVAGDLKVDMAKSGTGIIYTASANGWHPIRVTKIYKTGTTATNIVAGW